MVNEMTDNDAILDLCLRNATRYALGEIKFTMDLQAQMHYALQHADTRTRTLLITIFDIIEFVESEES